MCPTSTGHAEAAQLLLVTLEHLLERLGGGVRVEDRADAVLGDVVALHEQHDQQLHQPLGLGSTHGGSPGPATGDQAAARMSITK